MKVRKILLGTVAAAGIAVAAAGEPAIFPAITPAEAAVNVSVEISVNVFYDRLAAHGDWVAFHDRYVWVPHVEASWRPYLHGHWVYTRTYGWYWVSDEPFAWAVYHYGRWAFDSEIGWYWVPGRRWAPAWVVWSYTDDEIAWAPYPPDFDDDEVGVSISVSTVPVHYWHVVPIAFFVSIDLDDHVIRDRDHIRRVITTGEPKTVVVQNNIVVNNVIDVDIIEQKTKQKVVVYEEKPASEPEAAAKVEDNAIAVFNPEVKEEPNAKPPKLKKAEEVKQEKKRAGTLPKEPAEAAPAATEQPIKKKKTVEEAEQPSPDQLQADEQPEIKPKQGEAADQEVTPEEGQATETGQPVKKKKQQAVEEKQAPASEEKALQAAPEQQAPAAEEPEAVEKPAKKKEQKQACDPNVEDCPK
jgi:hypothetical protein